MFWATSAGSLESSVGEDRQTLVGSTFEGIDFSPRKFDHDRLELATEAVE
jgi:hypothetical protein